MTANAAQGVLANDTDPDTDALHVSAVNGVVGNALTGAFGTLTLNANGSYSYSTAKGGSASQGLPQDNFTDTVDDGHGGTSTATLTVSVIGNGQTYVKGTDSNDTLSAGTKGTVLDGGNGNDTRKDADTFVFNPNFGKDVITDFKPNADHIQIDDTLFANFAAVKTHAAGDGQGNTLITYDANNTITLTGVVPSQLHANDFFFV
ncbi:hypothetical protein E4K64_22510 [Bradyrhizobium frederickii]|uniref:Uncharacterized protein n=1 Tax=Bradyrhizobium frederickii TaxID=2560054 RepID=A0A4Y9NX91_9BRAD|nr:Ig-like domain-containing protein [Bradyrhizobium frederickii]TFV72659.1 hypothetical protein E4K64_22510 [Bradyrhizobium frederickii]